MKKNKGFTLIELLVVIAIIGILSSVVLASLSSARNKGKDAAVKSQLASMKAQAELYYSAKEAYYVSATSDVCKDAVSSNGFGGISGPGLLSAVANSSGVVGIGTTTINAAGTYNTVTCNAASTGGVDTWVVEAPLSDSKTGAPSMYCADNTGLSKTVVTTLTATSTACPTS